MFNDVDDLSNCTVVLVEDSAINQKIIHCCLADICEIQMFSSAEDALVYCKQSPPDLILMDWMLEGMTGVEACHILQGKPETADIPVIFVTSNTSEHQQELCWDAGAVDFIGKPIVARTLVHRVRTHLKYKKQADLLREYSYVDGLTGVYNRRYFELEIERYYRQSVRTQNDLSLIILDVDHFKLYNDHYGHLKGDDALKAVASVLKNNTRRPLDSAFRYGGEEFAVLLPNTPIDAAAKIAKKIVDDIAALKVPHEPSAFKVVTASAGVSSNLETKSTSQFIDAADEELYRAKENGRNRVCVANSVALAVNSD